MRKHSGAGLVEVVLGPAIGSHFAISVVDNGRGIDSVPGVGKPGLGTLGMQERAVILGGRLEVESVADGGTTVRAIIPKEQLI